MTQIEQIKAEIERLKSQLIKGACASQIAMETNCKEEAYDEVLSIIDKLPQDPSSSQNLANSAKTCKVEPKFKVGDKIIEKDFDECGCGTIIDIKDGKYIFDNGGFICIEEQGLWQLVGQDPAWSEEDERIYKVVLEILNSWSKGTISGEIIPPNTDRYINWLKFLKDRVQPQNTWKPSDEQMEALGKICEWISLPTAEILDEIRSLYNELKKLKG